MMTVRTCIQKIFAAMLVALILTGCATVPAKTTAKAVLIEHPERFFWELKADNASVYVLGTIHVADKSVFPLEEHVLKAFDGADRLVSELGGMAEMQKLVEALTTAYVQSINADSEKNLMKLLTQEELALLYDIIGESGVRSLAAFNPWVMNATITQLLLAKAGLKAADGIDLYLINRAGKKKVEALDTIEQQINVLSYGTFEDQLTILKETLAEAKNIVTEVQTLRDLYIKNDRKTLTAMLGHSLLQLPDAFSEEKMQAFVDVLLTNRNRIWARKFHEYLQAGGTTFVFAGTAHFLGDNSVFEIMKQNGTLSLQE